MLRAFGEKGGVGVYTRNVTRELLDLDDRNEYLLLYSDPQHLGTHAGRPQVSEQVLTAPHKLLWDQVAVPRACREAGVDVLFHPKFSVPLFAPCKTVMVLHGAGWFIPGVKQFWSLPQRIYARLTMPLYCRNADAVLAVSDITTRVFTEKFNLPDGRVRTVYLAPGRQFHRVEDPASLAAVREKYALPDRYLLTLSGFDRGPRKNIETILRAFQRVRGEVPHKLVVAGRDCHKFRETVDMGDASLWDDVIFPGWVDQSDLPMFYSGADLFLYPSKMEAFPIPLTEAMACGVPIVTSKVFGLAEVAGEAGIMVDPDSVDEIASSILRVLTDDDLHAELVRQSEKRGREFSWQRCAAETLGVLNGLA
jgi:glycosyltransferase involved in cell wall biosynthesis